ncbi:hypothetical protein Droror1_Dr00010499 [Drosera rotundifolia]
MTSNIFTTIIITIALLIFPLRIDANTSNSIHTLLEGQGLPGGIFPRNVKSFNLEQDGHLEVLFEEPCLAVYDSPVKFESVVRANLSYGGLLGLEGVSQEELFLWLPVKDIVVADPSSGVLLVNIVVAFKQLSLSLFEDPPFCSPPSGIWLISTVDESMGRNHSSTSSRSLDDVSTISSTELPLSCLPKFQLTLSSIGITRTYINCIFTAFSYGLISM